MVEQPSKENAAVPIVVSGAKILPYYHRNHALFYVSELLVKKVSATKRKTMSQVRNRVNMRKRQLLHRLTEQTVLRLTVKMTTNTYP